MTKIFPKSRICVVDCYPSFEKGLKAALEFTSKHNISLNSGDGKRLLLSFCLKTIQEDYKNTKSPFPKVMCFSKHNMTNKIHYFIEKYFDHMMEYLPIPYCGKHDLSSPDLECAAESSLKKQLSSRKFGNLISRLKVKKPLPFVG
jgi:hypothetical protein